MRGVSGWGREGRGQSQRERPAGHILLKRLKRKTLNLAAWMVVGLISEGDGLAGWEAAAGREHELLLWC